MKYFSMFSGIGGFELGIEKAWKVIQEQRQQHLEQGRNISSNRYINNETSYKCVGFSEIDRYAIQIYQRHFPSHRNFGDATKINPKDLPDFDMLCGGFPCQAFSIAGKRLGFEDTRGTLFFEIARIAQAKKPQILFLENVKGLLSHDRGRTFATILATLDELGYNAEWECLNSKNFGVPQNRERVFIIGHLREKPAEQVFPLGKSDGEIIKNEHGEAMITNASEREFSWKNIAGALTSRDYKEPKIVMTQKSGELKEILIDRQQIRRLTPTECERLQGFPDGWTEGVSDTQRYKTLGNAVTTNVVQAIAEKLFENIARDIEEGKQSALLEEGVKTKC